MLKDYFKIAVRHLTHKWFSAINILCLAIGISLSMITCASILNQRGDLVRWIYASRVDAVFITPATVSYLAIKAAVTNPLKSSRTE